jgi:hypothetical protein
VPDRRLERLPDIVESLTVDGDLVRRLAAEIGS